VPAVVKLPGGMAGGRTMEAAAFDARKLGEWGEYVHTHSSSGSKSEMNEGGTGFFTSFLGRASRSATADLGPLVDLTAAVFEPAAGCAYLSEYGTQGAHRGRREGVQWHGLLMAFLLREVSLRIRMCGSSINRASSVPAGL
jgi:hypothetical protein